MNYIKTRIQPVMDQIKMKYKKFRNSIIDDGQIQYLYEEENHDRVHTDVPTAQRMRPYEKAEDREGIPGLRETATGRFYYNLNTALIEERLSNGYYKRPKDFAWDVRTLVKDAQTYGADRDRIIKAKEILANVELDMALLELHPECADCENVYQREQERMRAIEERHRRRTGTTTGETTGETTAHTVETESMVQMASHVATIGSTSATAPEPTTIPAGGVTTEEPGATTMVPTTQPRQLTPLRTSPHDSSLSNGFSAGPANIGDPHHASNGSSVPSRREGDAAGTDSQHHEFARPSQPHRIDQTPPNSQLTQPYVAGMTSTQRERSGISYPSGANTQRSQKSVLTTMQPGSQVEDYVNEASTTTSGKKTSDESHRSSDPFHNTQSSSSVRRDFPDFSAVESKAHGDSQLPSTQRKFFELDSFPVTINWLTRIMISSRRSIFIPGQWSPRRLAAVIPSIIGLSTTCTAIPCSRSTNTTGQPPSDP